MTNILKEENYQEKITNSLKRTREIYDIEEQLYFNDKSQKIKLTTKINDEYSQVIKLKEEEKKKNEELKIEDLKDDEISKIIYKTQKELFTKDEDKNKYALVVRSEETGEVDFENKTKALVLQEKRKEKESKFKPQFHQNWKLLRGFLFFKFF
jgi:ATP phosphoribosyltransferase